jgi:hypothetical protein
MECLLCGGSMPEGNRFCGDCGAPAPVACTTCGIANLPTKRFCGDCGSPLGDGVDADRAAAAEHRQVTVLFCDLVDSTALSRRLDPEDLRAIIAPYHKSAADAIARFDGSVARYLGDGVLAYFGFPQAHEDDAERAVRTGLALVAAVSGLRTHAEERAQARIARAAGFAPDDPPDRKRQKLEAMMAQTDASEADVETFAELLSLPRAAQGPAPEASPQRRKERALEALLTHLHRLAAQQPVLMLFEDLHWLDPTSLELLTLLVESAWSRRILVVLTARPEFSAPWPAYAHVTAVVLSPPRPARGRGARRDGDEGQDIAPPDAGQHPRPRRRRAPLSRGADKGRA